MTTAPVVETSVTVTNSSFQNYTHTDGHPRQTIVSQNWTLIIKIAIFILPCTVELFFLWMLEVPLICPWLV